MDLDKNVKFGQICRGKHASRRNADEYASNHALPLPLAGSGPASLGSISRPTLLSEAVSR